MKRMMIVGALALTAGGQALAADLPPMQAPPPRAPATYVPVAAPVYNWGGVYVGLNAGGAFVNQGVTTNTLNAAFGAFPAGATAVGTSTTSSTGFAGGGQIGANFQMNQVVFGLEADADYLSNTSSLSGGDFYGGTATHKFTLDVLSTVRGRLGYAFDRTLIYGTGGLAMGEYQVQRTETATGPGAGALAAGTVDTVNNLRLGWTAGAGIEYAITDNWTAKVEYLYANLEKVTDTFPIANITQSAPTESVNLIRAGVNFKFGGF